jgi:hypothetical protein
MMPPQRSLSPIAAVALAALGLGVCLLFARAYHGPHLFDDSYQYLDAARSLASGNCFCTRVALFDEQVAYGRMPVPFTHFAPGFPILIAALLAIGVSPLTAGLLIAVAGFTVSFVLIWDIGLALGARVWAVAGVSLLWLAHYRSLWDATSVTTESAFTALLTAAAALIARDIRYEGKRPAALLLLGIAAGAAYDIRYAGLFILPVALIYMLWRWRRTRGVRWWAVGGILAIAALASAVMLHNFAYTGSWRGGFNSSANRSLPSALKDSFKSYYHLVFGDAVAARRDLWATMFCIAIAAVLFCVFRAFKERRYRTLPTYAPTAAAWLAILTAAYLGGVIVASLLTFAEDIPRYNRPIYPLALALSAPLLSLALRGGWIAAGAAAIAAILAINGRGFDVTPAPSPDAIARQALRRDLQPGVTGAEWLRTHLAPDSVLFSVVGQSVHYVVERNVVAFTPPPYIARPVDREGFRKDMTRFRARYLLVFPGLPPEVAEEQANIPFLRDLAAGKPAPDWLHEDARTAEIAIYECDSCAK